MKPPVLVAADDGYAWVKAECFDPLDGSVRTVMFPSQVGAGSSLASLSGEVTGNVYETAGRTYTVNPPMDAMDTRFDEYPYSDLNRVLVYHALSALGLQGRDVSLSTSLPPGAYFGAGASMNERLVSKKKESLARTVRSVRAEAPIRIVHQEVVPEGIAAIMDHMLADDGSVRREIENMWCLVDIGGRTTDVVTVVGGGAPQIDTARTGSTDIGALRATELLGRRLADEHDVNMDEIGGLDRALHTGEIRLWGRVHDVRHLMDPIVDHVAEEIIQFVSHKIGRAGRADQVLFVGGGASVFKSVLSRHPAAVIVEDPQMANARGMRKQMMLAEETA